MFADMFSTGDIVLETISDKIDITNIFDKIIIKYSRRVWNDMSYNNKFKQMINTI